MTPERIDINRRIVEAATYDTDHARHAVGQVLDDFVEEIDRLKEENRQARDAMQKYWADDMEIRAFLDGEKS